MCNIVAINYADNGFTKAQKLNGITAKYIGKVNQVINFAPNDIEKQFYIEHKNIIEEKVGGGLWLWKPYFIYHQLSKMKDGDILIYADSGSIYINDIHKILKFMNTSDIMSFKLSDLEYKYTKKMTFEYMGLINKEYKETPQILATFCVFRKSDFSLAFTKEWLEYCCHKKILDNRVSVDEHKEFIAHRNDQSIFSLLCKKYGIIPFRDPSCSRGFMDKNGIPQLFISTRSKNKKFWRTTIYSIIREMIRSGVRSNEYVYHIVKDKV